MKTLRHQIAEVAKHKRVPATLLETAGGVCTVRLGNNGRVLHGVPYSGGPGKPGDSVHVDYSSGNPIVLAQSQLYVPEPQPKKIAPRPPASEEVPPQEGMIQRFVEGKLAAVYEPSEDGMNEALAESAAGHLILLPVIELTMDFTVPQGVTVAGNSRFTSTIHGTLTLSKSAILDRLGAIDSENSDVEAIAVISTGHATIHDCNIWACNCGVGPATGARVTGGKLSMSNASLSGESEGGAGYGIIVEAGSAEIRETPVYGSSAQWPEDDAVYVHGTLLGASKCECEPVVLPDIIASTLFDHGAANAYTSIHQIPAVGQPGVTMGDVTALTVKASRDLGSEGVTGYGMTMTNAFIAGWSGLVYRMPLDGGSTDTMEAFTQGDSPYDVLLVVIDDNQVLALYICDTIRGDETVLVKLDFSTNTRTEIGRWDAEVVTFKTRNGAIYNHMWAARSIHASTDRAVFVSHFGTTTGSPQWHFLQVVIYDIANETLVSKDFYNVGPTDVQHTISLAFNPMPSPRVHNGKVICTVPLGWDSIPPIPDGCPFPLLVIDAAAGTVTIENSTQRVIADGEWGGCDRDGAIDPSDGKFYFFSRAYDGSSNALAYYDTDVHFHSEGYLYEWRMIQSPNGLYALDENYVLRAVPAMTSLAAGLNEWLTLPDDTNQVVWELRVADYQLHAISIGGAERTITTPYSPSSTMYKGANSRSMFIVGMLNGYLVLYVRSSGVSVQHEIIVLGA